MNSITYTFRTSDTKGTHHKGKFVSSILSGEWPSEHVTLKPQGIIHDHQMSLDTAYKNIIRTAGTVINQKLANYYISEWFSYMTKVLDEEWRSFNILIGNQGDAVSPLDILDILPGQAVTLSDISDSAPTLTERIDQLAGYLLTETRMEAAKASGRSDYLQTIRELLVLQMGIHENGEEIMDESRNLAADKTYRLLSTAFDTFLKKFPNNVYSKYRAATITTCFRDCGALGIPSALSKKMGISIGKVPFNVFHPEPAQEFHELMTLNQELGKDDSYLPYTRSMELINKSPYSITQNKNLHTYVMTFLALSGDKGGLCAKMMDEVCGESILKIALSLHYIVIGLSRTKRTLFEDSKAEENHIRIVTDYDAAEEKEGSDDGLDEEDEQFGSQTDNVKKFQGADIQNLLTDVDQVFFAVQDLQLNKGIYTSYSKKIINPRKDSVGEWLGTTLSAKVALKDPF